MNKHIIIFFISLFLLIFALKGQAFTSSSYMITNAAIKNLDYEKAYSYFIKNNEYLDELELNKKLITFINLGLFEESVKIAKEILKINNLNQDAWIVYLTNEKLNDSNTGFFDFLSKKLSKKMTLVDYTFFNDDKTFKDNKESAFSIFEIIEATIKDSELKNNNYESILFYLKICNTLNKEFYEGYYYLAQVYQFLKDFEKSELVYNMIPYTHNLYIESQKNIAFNKIKMSKFNEGENYLIQLINYYPDVNSLNIALADFYRLEKKYDKAILVYTDIITSKKFISSDYWSLLFHRAICYERLSEWNLAEKDLILSLDIKANSPNVLNYLAYSWLEKNIYIERALEMLKKAYEKDPTNPYIIDSLAWAYFKINNLKKASQLMEKAISITPGEAISLDHLGDIYFAMNRKREAIYLWLQAKDLAEPEDNIIDSLEKKLEKYESG